MTSLFHSLHDLSRGVFRQLAPGVETRLFVGEQAMLSVVRLDPHAEGPIHAHGEEQWGLLIEGSGIRFQSGESHQVKAGDFWLTPGGVPHGFHAGEAGALIVDVFAPPRRDFLGSSAAAPAGE